MIITEEFGRQLIILTHSYVQNEISDDPHVIEKGCALHDLFILIHPFCPFDLPKGYTWKDLDL